METGETMDQEEKWVLKVFRVDQAFWVVKVGKENKEATDQGVNRA